MRFCDRATRAACADPFLQIVIESEMIADVMSIHEGGGKALTVPPIYRQIPPACPFKDRQSVKRLEVHDRMESFVCIHVM